MKIINIPKNTFLRVAIVTGLMLLALLIAMQFIDGMVWTFSDFIVAGTIIFCTGSIFVLLVRKFPKHRIIIGIIIVLVFLWLWGELAVGIFTNWGN